MPVASCRRATAWRSQACCVGVEGVQPALGNGLEPVTGAGQHAGDGPGGVGIATAIDDINPTILQNDAVPNSA